MGMFGSTQSSSSHSSSEEGPLMQLSIQPERPYVLTGIVGVSGKLVSGGTSDFSLHHTFEKLSDYSLGIFQAKEAQLDLSNFSGETKSAIAQVGFQMLGEIHVRADEPEF